MRGWMKLNYRARQPGRGTVSINDELAGGSLSAQLWHYILLRAHWRYGKNPARACEHQHHHCLLETFIVSHHDMVPGDRVSGC
jgi:hypothetical protein